LVTDGETFEQLLKNLGEALELCLENAAEFDLAPDPRVVITLEMPYAKIA
jgi:predicted RNase H-like HicB family nuclease